MIYRLKNDSDLFRTGTSFWKSALKPPRPPNQRTGRREGVFIFISGVVELCQRDSVFQPLGYNMPLQKADQPAVGFGLYRSDR